MSINHVNTDLMLLFPAPLHPGQACAAAPTQSQRHTHSGNFLNAKDDFFLSGEACVERWERWSESDRFSADSGWIEQRCVWPVSPWPVPSGAEGQEVAWDPGRIQALFCVSASNHYQTLHSEEK